jgi:phage terminase large subunit GpA-like protein
MHWYEGIRGDWYEQITSEIKAPKRGAIRGEKVWQKKAGVHNEALDTEVYALHGARSLRTDIKSDAQWRAIEVAIGVVVKPVVVPAVVVPTAVAQHVERVRKMDPIRRGGFASNWR